MIYLWNLIQIETYLFSRFHCFFFFFSINDFFSNHFIMDKIFFIWVSGQMNYWILIKYLQYSFVDEKKSLVVWEWSLFLSHLINYYIVLASARICHIFQTSSTRIETFPKKINLELYWIFENQSAKSKYE